MEKDKKDYIIDSLEAQRNEALTRLTLYMAEAQVTIAALQAKVKELEAVKPPSEPMLKLVENEE